MFTIHTTSGGKVCTIWLRKKLAEARVDPGAYYSVRVKDLMREERGGGDSRLSLALVRCQIGRNAKILRRAVRLKARFS